jgi:phenylalanyl-tRNA synthetase beta chain
MAELGEPMHAFDRKKFGGDTILVRLARKGEKITTLDGIERNLHEEDVVITDGKNPIAIAGVMGGGNSEIDDNTTELILEAANFNAVSVRKTAFRHVLRTDAAMRYEKSLDPEICPDAIVRCFELIKMVCPEAEAQTQIIDVYPKKAQPITISITTDTIRRKLGAPLTDERITGIISSLGFDLKNSNGTLTIGFPATARRRTFPFLPISSRKSDAFTAIDNIAPEAPHVPVRLRTRMSNACSSVLLKRSSPRSSHDRGIKLFLYRRGFSQ